MLQREHFAILLTCIKRKLAMKTNFGIIFEWPLMTGFTVHCLIVLEDRLIIGPNFLNFQFTSSWKFSIKFFYFIKSLLLTAMMRDPGSTFMNYPEMRKMWLLLDYLPEIYETYQYTSLIAPDKVCCLHSLNPISLSHFQ